MEYSQIQDIHGNLLPGASNNLIVNIIVVGGTFWPRNTIFISMWVKESDWSDDINLSMTT